MQSVTTSDIFVLPKFRDGVRVLAADGTLSVEYREQSCDISVGDRIAEFKALAESLLSGNASVEELKSRHPQVAAGVDSLIEELDRLGLLTESVFPVPEGCLSGEEFYHRIRRLAENWIDSLSHSSLFLALKERTLSRRALTGYALEYFQIVRQAPGLIAPALGTTTSWRVQKLLQSFLASELNHDEMLGASLRALGMRPEALEYAQPLPATFALCASLGVYARQHPTSFYSLLFLFEKPSQRFHDELVAYCRDSDVPEAFWQPIVQHASINDEFDHEDISLALMREVDAIPPEEQTVVKKHLMIAIETMALQEQQIFDYYDNPANVVPRVFA